MKLPAFRFKKNRNTTEPKAFSSEKNMRIIKMLLAIVLVLLLLTLFMVMQLQSALKHTLNHEGKQLHTLRQGRGGSDSANFVSTAKNHTSTINGIVNRTESNHHRAEATATSLSTIPSANQTTIIWCCQVNRSSRQKHSSACNSSTRTHESDNTTSHTQ